LGSISSLWVKLSQSTAAMVWRVSICSFEKASDARLLIASVPCERGVGEPLAFLAVAAEGG